MKTIYFLLLIITSSFLTRGQAIKPVLIKELPSKLSIKGVAKKVYKWSDKDTINYIVYSQVGPYRSNPSIKDSIDGYLNGYPVSNPEYSMTTTDYYISLFSVVMDSVVFKWKIRDYVKDCDFDTRFRFIDNALSISDLDNNGIKEIWVMYSLGCRSDVSPDDLKLIMYEGSTKYAIRGYTRDYEEKPKPIMESEKTIDPNFINGDKRFKNFALDLWNRNNALILRID